MSLLFQVEGFSRKTKAKKRLVSFVRVTVHKYFRSLKFVLICECSYMKRPYSKEEGVCGMVEEGGVSAVCDYTKLKVSYFNLCV